MRARSTIVVGLIATFAVACITSAATISPISSPGGFLSGSTTTDDFEFGAPNDPPASVSPFEFEDAPKLGLAEKWTAGVTPSGKMGLVEFYPDGPLQINFATPVHEIGMFFGNDDFGRVFNANLELFDASNVSLGKIQVRSNGNDQADQYIGARSSVAVKSARIYYDQPNAQLLSVYIDDLKIGTIVPEPSSVALATCSLAGLIVGARRASGGMLCSRGG
jgi:hypothetical protein